MRLPPGRWRFMLLAIAAAAALAAFAACGEEEKAGPTETPPAGETPVGQRIQGGSLTVASVEGDALDPHFSSFASDISLERMLWRGPFTLDKENVPQPSMAEDLPEISADGKTYTITITSGLLWSDGDDLKAEDFVMGILRTCNPTVAGEYQYILSNIVGCDDYYGSGEATPEEQEALRAAVGIKVIDDLTYEITLASPQPTMTIILSLWVAFPVPVHLFPNPGDAWPAPAPDAPGKLAYNGPYILTEFEPGDHAALAPNPNWAAPAGVEPTLDRLVLRFIDDFAVADNAYRTGEVDFANVDLTQLSAVKAEFGEDVEYFRVLKPTTTGLEMNHDKPPLNDVNVRKALGRSIDTATLNEVCYQGGRVPTTSWVPEVTGGAAPDAFVAELGFDVAAAQQQLADGGFAGGTGFPTLTVLVRDDPTAKCLAEFLQEAWRTNLNVNVDIEAVDGPTRSARYTSSDFELFPGGWQQDYPDPENWIVGLFDTGGSLNNEHCSNAEIDQRIEKAHFDTNDTERLGLYKEVNELIAQTTCKIVPFFHVADHYLIKPYTVGMTENSSGQDGVAAGDWNAEAWGRSE